MRPRLLHWEEVEGSPADTGRRGRKLMELKRSIKSSVWWGSKTMEESGFVCGMSEEGEDWKWDNKPLRGWVFSNNSEEIDCQCGSLLSLFWFMSSFGTKFTFTSCDVNVNSVQ